MFEEKQVYGGLTAYRTRGDYLRRLEQYAESKIAHDEAFKINPNDVPNLMGRSLSCSHAMQPKQAYRDAELALQMEPKNLLAMKVQSQAMYTVTEFEKSIVANMRGNQIRPSYFKEAYNQGLETLQDCIGKRAGRVLLDFLPLLTKTEAAAEVEPHPPLRVSRIPRQDPKPKVSQKEAHQNRTLSRAMATKYLGAMASDKFFLESMVDDPRIISANKAGTAELQNITKKAYNSLVDRQNLLRTSRPYYSVKHAERTASSYQTNFLENVLKQERLDNARIADRLLKQVKSAMHSKNIHKMVLTAERMQIYIDSKTPKTLPLKDSYLHRLYDNVGHGFLSQYHLSSHQTEQGMRYRIAFLMGLSRKPPKTFDSVRANYPFKYGDVKLAIEKTTAVLESCENSTQRSFLYYELSRLYNSQKNFQHARLNAIRCQAEAVENESVVWWLNGCLAVLSGELQQGNVNEVKSLVKEALLRVGRLEYDDENPLRSVAGLKAFLEKCAAIAAECMVTDEQTVVKQRQRGIIGVMMDPERVEQQVLFKRIWAVPPGRRFSVMPSKTTPGNRQSERRLYRQRGLTVIPGQTPTLQAPPKRQVKGRLVVDL